MSFSFRSMFKDSAESPQPRPNTLPEVSMPGGTSSGFAAPPPMSAISSPPLNSAASPFGAPMFKVAPGENPGGMGAIQASPFAAAGAASNTSAPLTVGDVLPQLPPEVARSGALPPDQPVAISSQILDDALRSGQAAVPMFEIYRVCPALFQTPVSPQDPRMIPLPASKLPRLIAAAQSGASAAPAPMSASAPPLNVSPFGTMTPPATGGMMMESPAPLAGTSTPSGMLLPPRRQGPPPPLAEVGPREAAAQISLPGAAAFPMSPFAPVHSEGSATAPSAASTPFSAAPGMGGSPFSAAPATTAASPFTMMPEPSEAPASAQVSPFSAAPPAPGASPFAAQPPAGSPTVQPGSSSPFGASAPGQGPGQNSASPFGSLFGDKAVPTGQPAPDAPGVGPRMVTPGPGLAAGPANMPSLSASPTASSGPTRISLAGMLKGYTAAELGFDPMVVPTWITTSMSGSTLQELMAAPAPLVQLGFLIDGITDVGFRNVLNTARREFQIKIHPDVLQNATAGNAAPPALPSLASLGSPPSTAGPVMMVTPSSGGVGAQPGVMRIEPPSGFTPPQQPSAASPFAPPSASGGGMSTPFAAPLQGPGENLSASSPASPFAVPAQAPSATPSAPAFGMPSTGSSPFQSSAPGAAVSPPSQAPIQPLQSAFAPPAAAAPAPMAAGSSFATFQNTSAAPPQDPFAQPAPSGGVPLFQPAPSFQAPAPAFQPAPPLSAPLGGPAATSMAPPPMFLETTVLPPEPKTAPTPAFSAFKPPAQESVDSGFSSDQLLGQIQPPNLERTWSQAATAAASAPVHPEYSVDHARPAPVIDIPAAPASSFFDPQPSMEEPPPVRAFVPPTIEANEPARPVHVAQAPAPAARPAARPTPSPAASTNLGVQTHDANPDQIMLRALLDTESDLTPQRVVELTCGLPGIAACVCLQEGGTAFSHAGAHKPQAREFQKQASQLAQHLRALAPLIGIDGAETFTMNSGDRLMTFCFPEGAILGVLHDAEPTLGLRDKITLIARELSRMIV